MLLAPGEEPGVTDALVNATVDQNATQLWLKPDKIFRPREFRECTANAGKHNIYDFLARDPGNYLPYLSSAEIKGPKRSWKIGKYTIPLGGPRIKGMRRGIPFWHWLGEAGIFCSVLRVPVTFPVNHRLPR